MTGQTLFIAGRWSDDHLRALLLATPKVTAATVIEHSRRVREPDAILESQRMAQTEGEA